MNITITAIHTHFYPAHARDICVPCPMRIQSLFPLRGGIAVLAVLVGMVAGAPVASAQVYNWVQWISTGGQTAAATDPGLGTVTLVSPNGTGVTLPFPIRFDGVPFTPVDAPSVAIGNGVLQGWTLSIDFTQVPNTSGVIVGIGNFGHGLPSLPGYRLAAFDKDGLAMPLTALEQLGSYDHTWTNFNIPFNDDVTLNTATGDFVVTLVAGMNENNSDILLMSLPADVGRLEVSTVAPTNAETINIIIATSPTSSPTVTDQPDDVSACSGGGIATFTVVAEGAGLLSYQWRKNTASLSDGVTTSGSLIAGATGPTLTISSVSAADADTYDCIVSISGGTAISTPATLTVFASGTGDGNDDSLLNGRDISMFVGALLQGGSPSQTFCACDMSSDGAVDLADVTMIVSAMLAN